MSNFIGLVIVILHLTVFSGQALGGAWSPNNFLYKPSLGARGASEKASFDASLDRLDARLGKETWIGDPNYGTTLQEALTVIGASNIILRVPAGSYSVSADVTVPANVALRMERGATLTVTNAKTLTINGPFTAGRFQVISCTGTGKVLFGPGAVQEVYPEWWGGLGDGVTECGPAFIAALAAFPHKVKLTQGTYNWSSGNTAYLDSTNQDITYMLAGSGKGAVIKLPDWASGYAVKVNETSGGAEALHIPRHPRLVVKNLVIDGTGSAGASFAWVNTASVLFEKVRAYNLLYLARTKTGTYCDNMGFRDMYWHSAIANSQMYYQDGPGDGLVMDRVFASQTGKVARIYKTAGGSIRSCIGGLYEFEGATGILMEACHLEETGGISVNIKGSHITLRRNHLFNSGVTYPVQINDSGAYDASNVVLEDNTFIYLLRDTLPLRVPEIYIAAMSSWGKLKLRNNVAVNLQMSAAGGTRWSFDDQCGIVAAAADGTLNTVLVNAKQWLSGDIELVNKNTIWKVTPLSGQLTYKVIANADLVSAIKQTYYGNLAVGTYYYRSAYYNGAGWAPGTNERSVTTDASNLSVQLILAPRVNYTFVRIWRGTATGVYDRYVDIPLCHYRTGMYDHGGHVDGFAWITAGVPAVPTANCTYDGVLHENGYRTFWAAAAPSSAEFTGAVGDRTVRVPPAVGQPKAWSCTVAGTPGTWTSEGNL
jgi:hypothetical protein